MAEYAGIMALMPVPCVRLPLHRFARNAPSFRMAGRRGIDRDATLSEGTALRTKMRLEPSCRFGFLGCRCPQQLIMHLRRKQR